jgi:hypothetical protein
LKNSSLLIRQLKTKAENPSNQQKSETPAWAVETEPRRKPNTLLLLSGKAEGKHDQQCDWHQTKSNEETEMLATLLEEKKNKNGESLTWLPPPWARTKLGSTKIELRPEWSNQAVAEIEREPVIGDKAKLLGGDC